MVIETENYRGLPKSSWSPSGVCAVVGPNGSGKTTLLSLPYFLRTAYLLTIPGAIGFTGANWGLRTLGADPSEPLRLRYQVDSLVWELELATRGSAVDPAPGETVRDGANILIRRVPFADTCRFEGQQIPCDERTCLKLVHDATRDPRLMPLVQSLKGALIYCDYGLTWLRRRGSEEGSSSYLQPDGHNAFTVLRNWRDRREWRPRYEFVTHQLMVAFPDLFREMDFLTIGQTVSAEFYHPAFRDPIPIHAAPNGLLVGLLHLCAVAGGTKGGLIAIDEMENALHPYAIRQLIRAFREWSAANDVTVAVATHSPVVLDEFDDDPDRLFVIQPDQPSRPRRVTELADREWLGQFTLGRLYSSGDVGSPTQGHSNQK